MNFVQHFIARFPYFKPIFFWKRQSFCFSKRAAACKRLFCVAAHYNFRFICRNKFYKVFRTERNALSASVAESVYYRCSIFYINRFLRAYFHAVTQANAGKTAVVQWTAGRIYYCAGLSFFCGKRDAVSECLIAAAQDYCPLGYLAFLLRLIKFFEFMFGLGNKHFIFYVWLFFYGRNKKNRKEHNNKGNWNQYCGKQKNF